MRRGEVWVVDLNPARGSEANKVRPAVIVSNDGANAAAARTGRGTITVVPLTTNTTSLHPFQALVEAEHGSGLSADSKAQCEQVRAISPQRLHARLGAIPMTVQRAIDDALRLHLGL